MAESRSFSCEESVHEGTGSGSGELDPNYSSSSLYLLGIVNQSQNASFGVEESMFRPESPTYKQVLDLIYCKSLEAGGQMTDTGGPRVTEVVETVRSCMFQTGEGGGVGNEHEILLQELTVQLELQKSPGDFLTRDNFNLALDCWIHSVSSQESRHLKCSTPRASPYSDADPVSRSSSLTGSYSLEGTGGASSGRETEYLMERVEELTRLSSRLQTDNKLLHQQLVENEETISDLSERKSELESQLAELRSSLHNNQSLNLENSALKQELSKLDSSLSETKQRLFQETKHRQTLEAELDQCSRAQPSAPGSLTYLVEETAATSLQGDCAEMSLLQDRLDIASSELARVCAENEHLRSRVRFLTDKNSELSQQISDLEQELGQSTCPEQTPSDTLNSTPTNLSFHTPSLEQELALFSPISNGFKCSSTPLSSLHTARETAVDATNSSLELLESLSSDPQWKQLCSLKSAQSDRIRQKTDDILSDIRELDCGKEYAAMLEQFRTKHLQLQRELEESLHRRLESDREAERLRGEVSKLREQMTRLQQQLGDVSQVRSHGDTLIAEMSGKDEFIKQLSGEVKDLSSKLALNESQTAKIVSLEEKLGSLMAENAKLVTSLQEKSQLIAKLSGERECIETQLDLMKRDLEDRARELRTVNTDKIEAENQLNSTSQLLNAKTEETEKASQEQRQTLAELSAQQACAAEATQRLNRTRGELESFHLKHVSCLRDLWHLSQGTNTPIQPTFNPTYEQVKEAIAQRIQTGDFAKSATSMLSHSLPPSGTSTPDAAAQLSLTPTAFSYHSPEKPPSLISIRSSPFAGDLASLQERVRAIQMWYMSAQYTTKPTFLAWKQHLAGLEDKAARQLDGLEQALTNGEHAQVGKLLKRLRNTVTVLNNCSGKVGQLEHECGGMENYRVLLEYIDFLKRGAPNINIRGNESLLARDKTHRAEDPLLAENRIGCQLFRQEYDPYPDLRGEIDQLKQTERILQQRADTLADRVKAIKPVKSGVTFRGIVVNLHFTLSLFFLLAFVYILFGPFPQSLPIIRHKMLFGQIFHLISYFYDPIEFTPIV